jgi:hypothetical protein
MELVDRRSDADWLQTTYATSERRVCGLVGMAVASYRYRSQRRDEPLRTRLVELAREKPCSTLSGVECLPYTPCAARLKTSTPPPHSGSTKLPPLRAQFATLPGRESAADQDRKAQLIGPGSGRGSAAGTPPDSPFYFVSWNSLHDASQLVESAIALTVEMSPKYSR